MCCTKREPLRRHHAHAVRNLPEMSCSSRTPIMITLALVISLFSSTDLWAFGAGVAVADDPGDFEIGQSMLIATADFNHDGIADVAEIAGPGCKSSGPCFLLLLLGQKDGSFKTVLREMLANRHPQSMVAGDLNGDGNADLLVGDDDGAVIELLGDGKGNLRSGVEIAHVGSVVSIAVGDFNRDGIPDIAVSDFRASAVTILLGAGHGAFRIGWSFALPRRGTNYYLAAADFNGDGLSDLAITSDEEGTFVVMLGNGNGTFTYAPALSNMRDPNSYCPT